jgi:hypothetical protein
MKPPSFPFAHRQTITGAAAYVQGRHGRAQVMCRGDPAAAFFVKIAAAKLPAGDTFEIFKRRRKAVSHVNSE